jgi:UDP:flavonoid glycosyltransferase YjiC (YdhE family)
MPKSFLFATMPGAGHTNPLKPIARALVERGHSVRWYAGRRFQPSVESTGATHVPMTDAIDYNFDNLEEIFPDRVGLTGLSSLRYDFKHVFLDPAVQQLADLRAILAQTPADAVIADQGVIGAAFLHRLDGVPWISVGITAVTVPSRDTAPFGLGLPPSATPLGRVRNRALNTLLERVLLRDVGKHARMVRGRVGLPTGYESFLSTLSPLLHLQNGIPEVEYPRSDLPPQIRFVGNLAERAGRAEPPPWADDVMRATVPVVHVTQGTVADGDLTALVIPTIDALAGEDVLVIAGTGRGSVGPTPANVRTAPFIPHAWLLPETDAMVTNGGYGGVQAALSNGVPLVVAGDTEEKPEIAAHVAWTGAGLNLKTGKPGAAQIREAVRTILERPAYRQRAQELRDIYGKLDAGQESATLIEQAL